MNWLSLSINPPESVQPVVGRYTDKINGKLTYQVIDLDPALSDVFELVKILDECGYSEWAGLEL